MSALAGRLVPLFEAARSAAGGAPCHRDTARAEGAVKTLLGEPIEELRRLAGLLGLERARRWKAAERVRNAIAAEIVRQAFRNDVFLRTAEARP